MSSGNGQARRLEVEMDVIRTPETILYTNSSGVSRHQPMEGYVTYIHPEGRFHVVAFRVKGGVVKEGFKGVSVE